MCVVGHSYGGLDGAEIKVVDVMHAGQSTGGWSHVGRYRSNSRVGGHIFMKTDHTAVLVRN